MKFKRNKTQKNYFELILTYYSISKYYLSKLRDNILGWNERENNKRFLKK